MKLLAGNDEFKLNGFVVSDHEPEKCEDWDADFGSTFSCSPEQVDLRGLMTPVENQGRVGSCTANAVAGAYEYLCNVRARETGDTPGDIARLFIYYAARKCDLHSRGKSNLHVTDSGSSISGAINLMAQS